MASVDLTTAKTTKKLTRREKFYKRYKMYKDDYESQVIERLKEIYTRVSDIKMDKQLDLTNNIYKAVVKKISRVYSFGAEREFEDDKLKELYDTLKIDKTMIEANRYVNAFNDVLLQVGWDFKKNLPSLIFRLPHNYKIEEDNGDLVGVEYFVSEDDNSQKWAYWNKTQHYYKIYSGKDVTIEPIEGNEEMINPYGVLPFIVMQNGFRDSGFFDIHKGDDLTAITLDNAIYNTFKNHLIKWQTFKQIAIVGNGVADFNGQILDPSTALVADGENVDIKILDLQANIKELQSVLDSAVSNVSINYNISPSQFKLSGNTSSGFALKMENLALDEDTLLHQKDFVSYETELYKLILLVSEKNNVIYKEGFNITINEPNYPEDKDKKIDRQQKEIDLGTISPIEVIAQNRGVTIEEATKIFQENIKVRNEMLDKVTKSEGFSSNVD